MVAFISIRRCASLMSLALLCCAGCRDGAKQPAAFANEKAAGEKKTPEPAPIPPARIVVQVEDTSRGPINRDKRFDFKGGPWIYVDEKLVARMDRPQDPWCVEIPVKPGPHRVAVCSVGFPKSDSFPFEFQEYRITAQSGETYTITSKVPGSGWAGLEGFEVVLPERRAEYLQKLEVLFETRVREIQLDLLVRALDRVFSETKKKPPARKVVWLEIPGKFGGAREVDAVQVNLLVDALKRSYWGALTHPHSPLNSFGEVPAGLLARVQRLKTLVAASNSLLDEFRTIARALELAEKD